MSNVQALMEQAQVFASAWSLVGGPFDNGSQLETANEEKATLQEMLEEATSGHTLRQFVEAVQAWHSSRLNHLKEVAEGVKEGTTVKLEGSDSNSEIVLTKRDAAMFMLGFEAVFGSFEKLPFTVGSADEEDEDSA